MGFDVKSGPLGPAAESFNSWKPLQSRLTSPVAQFETVQSSAKSPTYVNYRGSVLESDGRWESSCNSTICDAFHQRGFACTS